MYASHGFLRSDIGDVDVVWDGERFHLFHLVLPNHDFIAHAVSDDALMWKRVPNALWVGDPGTWDDDMLWTMSVTRDPWVEGRWRMFYTGLSRKEWGRVQRVGLAVSDDLYKWEKVNDKYPIEARAPHYEHDPTRDRKWVSFRDPFYYHEEDERLLLVAARSDTGPLIRRGCVAALREVGPNQFEPLPPLHRPNLYDDVEVPNLIRIAGRFFLLGSIREDVKVHYWYADDLKGPYENFFDNVLLPGGNYAARVCRADDQMLLFNFFQKRDDDGILKRMLPPPKELAMDATGRLRLTTYRGFNEEVVGVMTHRDVGVLDTLFHNATAHIQHDEDDMHLSARSGYEAFLLPGEQDHCRVRCRLDLEGEGKCGLVLRLDEQANGYYLSLDLIKGIAQIRAWGEREGGTTETAFDYQQLQAANFLTDPEGPWELEVVLYGQYIECAINDYVVLTLADHSYRRGRAGFYVESAKLRVSELRVDQLRAPRDELHPVEEDLELAADHARGGPGHH
ncbi:MAG: glycosyl hydrolase [Planctomycetota bacterium]